METYPLVTIGIPNYNYAHYILECLNSVANQTYGNIELIIVDDVSTDNSIEVIENWVRNYTGNININFIKNDANLGLTKVCNLILKNAKGKYFQTLDADDLLLPHKIQQQVDLLRRNKDAALVYSNIGVIDQNGKVIEDDYLKRIDYDKNNMPEGRIHEALFDFNFIPLPSVLVNTEMACEAGGFDETLQVQDYYLWLKLSRTHIALYLPETTALYRVHQFSMSNSSTTNPRSIESVLDIKYRYYHESNDVIKKKIRRDIHFSAVYLYEHKVPSAPLWLKRDLLLNPGIKSLGYFIAIRTGIPFSIFGAIKKIINKNRSNA